MSQNNQQTPIRPSRKTVSNTLLLLEKQRAIFAKADPPVEVSEFALAKAVISSSQNLPVASPPVNQKGPTTPVSPNAKVYCEHDIQQLIEFHQDEMKDQKRKTKNLCYIANSKNKQVVALSGVVNNLFIATEKCIEEVSSFKMAPVSFSQSTAVFTELEDMPMVEVHHNHLIHKARTSVQAKKIRSLMSFMTTILKDCSDGLANQQEIDRIDEEGRGAFNATRKSTPTSMIPTIEQLRSVKLNNDNFIEVSIPANSTKNRSHSPDLIKDNFNRAVEHQNIKKNLKAFKKIMNENPPINIQSMNVSSQFDTSIEGFDTGDSRIFTMKSDDSSSLESGEIAEEDDELSNMSADDIASELVLESFDE